MLFQRQQNATIPLHLYVKKWEFTEMERSQGQTGYSGAAGTYL